MIEKALRETCLLLRGLYANTPRSRQEEWAHLASNQGPTGYEPVALPTELWALHAQDQSTQNPQTCQGIALHLNLRPMASGIIDKTPQDLTTTGMAKFA